MSNKDWSRYGSGWSHRPSGLLIGLGYQGLPPDTYRNRERGVATTWVSESYFGVWTPVDATPQEVMTWEIDRIHAVIREYRDRVEPHPIHPGQKTYYFQGKNDVYTVAFSHIGGGFVMNGKCRGIVHFDCPQRKRLTWIRAEDGVTIPDGLEAFIEKLVPMWSA